MGSQTLLYLLIKYFIHDYHLINSIINIPLIKPFIYIYNSWYPFIFICAFLIYKDNNRLFYAFILSLLLSALLAQITFIIYPTIIERPTIYVNNITDLILNITYKLDNPPINCLPSMHCIYCFITVYYILKSNIKKKYLFNIYLLLIVLSTLFTNQHIIEDVIAALVYSIIAILMINKFKLDSVIKKITH